MVLISLSDNSSEIRCMFYENIILDPKYDYEICLLSFNTYNSIPNISEKLRNNKLQYTNDDEKDIEIINPTGTYDIIDIHNFIKQVVKSGIDITTNNNTLKVEIFSRYKIDFTQDDSVGPLLGFSKQIIPKLKTVESDLMLDIMKINSILIKCNIACGSYKNNVPTNIIHSFHIKDSPGYKIDEVPKNLIYLPLNTHSISELSIIICDQDDNLIDFRNENISVTLHIRKMNN